MTDLKNLKEAILTLNKVTGKILNDIEAQEVAEHMVKSEKSENNWTDLQAMMDDIREHAKNNGRAVVEKDLPRELKMGWKCGNTGKAWFIRIADLKRCIREMPLDKQEILVNAFQTMDGKENLTKTLNNKE